MKVKETQPVSEVRGPAKDGGQTPESRAGFINAIRDAEDRGVMDRLRAKADEIFNQGQKLSDKVDIRELRVYKKLISDFLDEAVGNSRKFSKQSFLDRRGRHKVYAVIKKVNDELDDLTREVLQGEKDHIKILKKLDDIKGLILDILM